MKELKVTIDGVKYTAPPPRMKEFKEYLKMLREIERTKDSEGCEDIDAKCRFIAALFRSPEVTPDTLDEVDLAEGVRLQQEYLDWFDQFFPRTEKNAKAR